MIVNRNKADLYASVWNILLFFFILSLGAVTILIVIASRQLAGPHKQLSRATNLILKGDFSARVPSLKDLEAGTMANLEPSSH